MLEEQQNHLKNPPVIQKPVPPPTPPDPPAPQPPSSLSRPLSPPSPPSAAPDVQNSQKSREERVLDDWRVPIKTKFVRREGQWTIDASSP